MMVKRVLLLSLLGLSGAIQANKELVIKTDLKTSSSQSAKPAGSKWYTDAQIGHGWTRNAGVCNPDTSFWDGASEGYDSDLGHSGFTGVVVGRQMCRWSALEFEYDLFQTMGYQKYQTTTTAGSTAGFTGTKRMRFFNVDHQAALVNVKLLAPKDWALNVKGLKVAPTLGAGLGLGINTMSNFHTVGYNQVEDVAISTSGTAITSTTTLALGSTTSIALPQTKIGLAWQANFGLTFQPANSDTTFGVLYRYYEGGKFASAGKFMLNTADQGGAQVAGAAWTGKLKMHQLVIKVECPF